MALLTIGRKHAIPLVALAAALLLALAPFSNTFIERVYSMGIYLHVQPVVTTVSNLVPFALFDVLLLVIIGMWMVALTVDIRRERGQWKRVLAAVATRSMTWACVLYIAFLLLWGLNYRRVKLSDKLQVDSQAISPEAALSLASMAVNLLNARHDQAHVADTLVSNSMEPALMDGFRQAQQELGAASLAVPGRPKPTLLNPLFRLTEVSGMTDPYFLEILIDNSQLPVERPFTVAHEWGHLAGLADESEASFAAWLTCVHGSPADQYSGWLFVFQELLQVVRQPDRAELIRRLAPGPVEDLRMIYERERRQVSPGAARVSSRVYDRYLKANRIPSGVANYGEVVSLLLGVRFGPGWTPQRKAITGM